MSRYFFSAVGIGDKHDTHYWDKYKISYNRVTKHMIFTLVEDKDKVQTMLPHKIALPGPCRETSDDIIKGRPMKKYDSQVIIGTCKRGSKTMNGWDSFRTATYTHANKRLTYTLVEDSEKHQEDLPYKIAIPADALKFEQLFLQEKKE